VPISQFDPNPQALPQLPQLFESNVSVVHVPLQLVSPEAQPHDPLVHVVPPWQTVPQPPQLLLSLATSRH
jgi:hypothetical protein